MPHPIFGRPEPRLARVQLVLTLPTIENGRHTRLEATGWSPLKRSSLWSVSETWTAADQRGGLEPTDAAHHLLLVACQDRPSSQNHLERSLTGQGWEQLELDL